MSVSSTLFLTFFSYIVSLLFVHRFCHILLVLKSIIIFLWVCPCTWPASPTYALVKDWLQGHLNPCSSTGSCSQRGPVLSLMLCCYCFETLHNFWEKALHFHCARRCRKLCSQSCLFLISCDFAELTVITSCLEMICWIF